MKKISYISIAFAVLLLTGQGCLPFGKSSQPSGDGGIWQTVNDGKEWAQLSAMPQKTGVGTIGGVSVNEIHIDPRDNSVYYLATQQNGIIYTYDNGSTWQRPKAANVREGRIIDVKVDPRNVCMIYALTPRAVLKSVDCARSFEQVFVESRADENFTAFVMDWFNPDGFWLGTSGGEVLRSLDGARTWTAVANTNNAITDIELSNADSRVVFVATRSNGLHRRDPETGEFISYRRTLSEYSRSQNVRKLAQTANGSRMMMSTDYGIFISDDKGENWQPLNLITPPREITINAIAIDPEDINVMYYVSDATFHVTRSAGQTWAASQLPSSRTVTALEVHPQNRNVVIAGFTPLED